MDGSLHQLLAETSERDRAAVIEWWESLSPEQRTAISQVVESLDHDIQVTIASDEADHDSNSDDWETDWREFLTEHTDVKVATQIFRSRSFLLETGVLNIHVDWNRVNHTPDMLPPSEGGS